MEIKENIDITLLVVVATMGVTILIFFIIFLVLLYQKRFLASRNHLIALEKQHQQELLKSAIEIAEYERQKTAANLHDDVGIIFSVLRINIGRIKNNLHKPEVIDKIISESFGSIDTSLESIRSIYRDMMPFTLKKAGLVAALNELGRGLSAVSDIAVTVNNPAQELLIDKDKEMQLYRLFKEIVNNTVKHAKPSNLEITINQMGNKLLLLNLEHNGEGISTAKVKELASVSSGLGLKSILTRCQLIHASIEFTAAASGNALVEIKMPLNG